MCTLSPSRRPLQDYPARRQITAHTEPFRRDRLVLQRTWEPQAEHRADFIAQADSDLAAANAC